jgi:hypothetical protein
MRVDALTGTGSRLTRCHRMTAQFAPGIVIPLRARLQLTVRKDMSLTWQRGHYAAHRQADRRCPRASTEGHFRLEVASRIRT